MSNNKVIAIEDRIPKLKQMRRQKANRRFILYISLFFVLMLIIIYFQSPLSKVQSIQVSGNIHVRSNEIIKLSGLQIGTNFWKIDLDDITKKVKEHEEISSVKVTRKFPNEIQIVVKEYERVAYLIKGTHYFPILETGKILKKDKLENIPVDAPYLMNWDQSEELQEMAAELRLVPPSILNRISEIHLTPEKADPLHITLFMNDGHEVSATIRDFANKIKNYPMIIEHLPKGQAGIIHLEVGSYFEAYGKSGDEEIESER
ncbi:cell division protein FtsQ/DivIB [Calidifontibacillus erzurumensis]|uniref:Cell division protein DivIB n=1 Tax=Calidifontibacillus erzurumensis TaxID=2741433 RepID=A0A8J8KB81_9BACI|nr:cell division protein FtsQ/DivIB [Calidifontibacillus erzurumensis]NSL50783.1 cell division protein FtsQ/DivIB [Calidifontibacillus erzurumensis]